MTFPILLLNWISLLLSNRSQNTHNGSFLSDNRELSSGVIQGSIIGLLLFVLYISDVVDLFIGGVVSKLFAGDVKLYYTLHSDADRSQPQSSLTAFWNGEGFGKLTFLLRNAVSLLLAMSTLRRRESITSTGVLFHLSDLLKISMSPFSQTCNFHYTSCRYSLKQDETRHRKCCTTMYCFYNVFYSYLHVIRNSLHDEAEYKMSHI